MPRVIIHDAASGIQWETKTSYAWYRAGKYAPNLASGPDSIVSLAATGTPNGSTFKVKSGKSDEWIIMSPTGKRYGAYEMHAGHIGYGDNRSVWFKHGNNIVQL